ncbi:MAG: hypothetical protein O7A63_06685 [Acidobacteria bacterium]|nr:hypothetical protein [Acidobacteriota bacterium]
MSQETEHLRLLSVFHYVVAGLAFLFSLFPVIHLILGITLVAGVFGDGQGEQPPEFVVWIFIGIALFAILMGLSFATSVLMAGRFLAQRRHYTFCLVVAALSCMFMPFGTVLGVFTIIVLVRDPVKRLFEGTAAT